MTISGGFGIYVTLLGYVYVILDAALLRHTKDLNSLNTIFKSLIWNVHFIANTKLSRQNTEISFDSNCKRNLIQSYTWSMHWDICIPAGLKGLRAKNNSNIIIGCALPPLFNSNFIDSVRLLFRISPDIPYIHQYIFDTHYCTVLSLQQTILSYIHLYSA